MKTAGSGAVRLRRGRVFIRCGTPAVNPAKRRAIFERFREANPAPRTELSYRTPFELLVAVILSAQATDKSVNKATAGLFRVANTPAAILALGIKGLTPFIKSIGLYNSKAKNIIATCEALVAQYGGRGAAHARGARGSCRASGARPRTS